MDHVPAIRPWRGQLSGFTFPFVIAFPPTRHSPRLLSALALFLASCSQPEDAGAWRAELFSEPEEERAPLQFEETIHRPGRLRGIAAPGPDGAMVRVACASCHGLLDDVELSTRAPSRVQPDVGGPHVGLAFDHGTLDCAHCHEPSAPSMLHTADGRRVPTTEALQLCVQCHGPQWTDYQHGAHGGMRGAWDLNTGPRERNHCVDCHDPHQPAFGQYQPMPPPRDRFAPASPHDGHGEGQHEEAER